MKHVISCAQLKSQLNNVVVFDCRFHLIDKQLGADQYRAGHIPGATFLDLEKDLSGAIGLHGGRHPLPEIDTFSEKLRAAGLNQHSIIVVYDDSRMAYAARAWWLLRYCGHATVLILDGGFSAWINAGGSLDRRTPSLKNGNFKARIQPDWMVNRTDILTEQSNLTLIDSREAKRFRGEEEPIDPIAGHIPSALNYFWQDATTEQGFIKSEEEQRQRWSELSQTSDLAVYCGSGVTACVNLLSLDISGIHAKLYPGSWSDWCSYLK